MNYLIVVLSLWFKTIETPNFYIYYKSHDSLNALRVAKYLEYFKSNIDRVTGGNPQKPYIFIEDLGTLSNGYTDPLSNSISLFNYIPESDFHFGATKSWWRTVAVHEYTHLSHLTNVRFPVNEMRKAIGKILLPNQLFLPLYMIEGITVLMESSIDTLDGRLNEGFFDAYLKYLNSRRKMRPGVYINHLPVDYPYSELPYLIGSEFTEFIFKKYGDFRLNRYYSTLAHMPITVPFIDIPGLIAFKKPVSWIYNDWRKNLKKELPYVSPQQGYIEKAYGIKYMFYSESNLYYVKSHLKRLSGNYVYQASELVKLSMETRKKTVLYTGDITLPIRVRDENIYFGIPEVELGKENISYYGIKFLNVIVKLEKEGKIKKLIQGRIRTFDVKNDTVYFVEEEPNGKNILFAWMGGRPEPVTTFDSTTIKEIVAGKNSLFIITHEETKGSQILELKDNSKIDTIIQVPFTIASISYQNDTLYFSTNYQNFWQLFMLDLIDKVICTYNEEALAFNPTPSPSFVYYSSIDIDGEVIKLTEKESFRKCIDLSGFYQRFDAAEIPIPEVKYHKNNYYHLSEAFFHDLVLPYFVTKDEKILIPGLEFFGHTPLNLFEYDLIVRKDTSKNSNITVFYNGIPGTSLGLRLSLNPELWAFGVGRIMKLKGSGYLRQWNMYAEAIPMKKQLSISAVFASRFYPDVDQYFTGIWNLDNQSMNIGIGNTNFVPIRKKGVLMTDFTMLYNLKTKGYTNSADVRLSLPLLRINWGNDAVIHFFYERNFITFEGYYTYTAGDTSSTKIAGATLDHLLSILNGNLKITIRTGIMGDIGRKEPIIYIGFEPASYNFSHGIFRKRWILRELTGKFNLL
ncbi:MAG: hypothetical protein ABIM31_02530 [candidate division WOR-3 bacterium]